MAEYIGRAELMILVESEAHRWGDDYDRWQCLADIEDFPAADVRPVVLCKDCDLWNEWDSSGRESLGTYRCSCAEWTTEITTYYTGPDEFCSRGVRRDSDG